MWNIIEFVIRHMEIVFGQPMLIPISPGSVLQMVIIRSSLYSVERALKVLGWILCGEPQEPQRDTSTVWLFFRSAWFLPKTEKGTTGSLITVLLVAIPVALACGASFLFYLCIRDLAWTLEHGVPFKVGFWAAAIVYMAMVAIAVAYVLLTVAVEYLVAEFERRRYRCLIFTRHMFIVGTFIDGTAFLSISDTEAIAETKMGRAGERMEAQSASLLGRIWDGWLYKWSRRRVGLLRFPVKQFRGEDDLDYVDRANTTLACVVRIADLATESSDLAGALGKKVREGIIFNPEQRRLGSGEEQTAEMRRAFVEELSRLTGVPIDVADLARWQIVDAYSFQDPGFWDRQTGEPTKKATVAATLPVFPPA